MTIYKVSRLEDDFNINDPVQYLRSKGKSEEYYTAAALTAYCKRSGLRRMLPLSYGVDDGQKATENFIYDIEPLTADVFNYPEDDEPDAVVTYLGGEIKRAVVTQPFLLDDSYSCLHIKLPFYLVEPIEVKE